MVSPSKTITKKCLQKGHTGRLRLGIRVYDEVELMVEKPGAKPCRGALQLLIRGEIARKPSMCLVPRPGLQGRERDSALWQDVDWLLLYNFSSDRFGPRPAEEQAMESSLA